MKQYKIIVVGASAGGVQTLQQLVEGLPADLPAAVFVVLHVFPYGNSMLPAILNRAGALKASHAEDEEQIQPGRIYVAPPNNHLLLKSGFIRLSQGPRENGTRPAIDPLFRTAARAYNTSVIGVVLSGTLDNGSVGLLEIKKQGGIAIVQDPKDALYDDMPRNAIDHVEVDRILPISEIPAALTYFASKNVAAKTTPTPDSIEYGSKIVELEQEVMKSDRRPGKPSEFVCPDCGGVLWEKEESNLLHLRCRIGHAYTEKSFISRQTDKLEEALWAAYRSLQENASLYRRMGRRTAKFDTNEQRLESYEQRARTAQQQAELIRQILLDDLEDGRE